MTPGTRVIMAMRVSHSLPLWAPWCTATLAVMVAALSVVL
jgi:hypothetical protein